MKRIISLEKKIPYAILLLFCLVIFVIPIRNLDELWNYNYARGIANGLNPYSEISMVQTPIAAYICAVFLCFFGKGLIVYRLAGYCLLSAILCVCYNIVKKQFQNQLMAFLVTILVLQLIITSFIYDYNYLSLLIVLIIMNLESKAHCFQNAVIGILVGILPFVKQTTGSAIFLLNLFVCFCFWKAEKEGSLAKRLRLILSFFPGSLFLIYLMCEGTVSDFIDYTVLGVGAFVHKITFIQFMKESVVSLFFAILSIGMLGFSLFHLIIKKEFEYKKIMCLITAGTWFLMITYPLFDFSHCMLGIVPLILVCSSFVGEIDKDKDTQKKLKLTITAIIMCLLILVIPDSDEYKVCQLDNFEGILIHENMEMQIQQVCDYMKKCEEQSVEVYIADSTAAVYMIPQNRYTKNWDMLLIGNLGTATIDELLAFEKQGVFLVLKDEYELNQQSHFQLIEYIKENYRKIDEVQNFDVYEIKRKR